MGGPTRMNRSAHHPSDTLTRPRAGQRADSGSFQSIAMPCCGTTRMMHDDQAGWKRKRCTKCGRVWWVEYRGEGRFAFRRKKEEEK